MNTTKPTTKDMIQLLNKAALYLEHPEVQAIPFAAPPSVTATQLRDLIEYLRDEMRKPA